MNSGKVDLGASAEPINEIRHNIGYKYKIKEEKRGRALLPGVMVVCGTIMH